MIHLQRKNWTAGLILVIALLVRLWDLNGRSLWFDEAYEYWSAAVRFDALFSAIKTSFQPPLYTILLHFWLVFGEHAVWMRLLSVIFSIIAIAVVMKLAWETIGKPGALCAGLVMAFFAADVKYAQEVAEYALMECLLAWSLYFLYRSLKNCTWMNLIRWAFFSVLAVYSHYGAAIVVAAAAAAVLLEEAWLRDWGGLVRHLLAGAVGAAAGLPLLFFLLPRQIQTQLQERAPFRGLIQEGRLFLNAPGETFLFLSTGWPFSNLPKGLGMALIAVILIISILILFFGAHKKQKRLIAWFWAAFLLYFFLVRSGLYAYGNLSFRYALVLSPLFVLLIAAVHQGINRYAQHNLRSTPAASRSLLLLSYLLLFGITIISAYSLPNRTLSTLTRGKTLWPETEDMREITRFWSAKRTGGEPVYVFYGAAPAYNYYLEQAGTGGAVQWDPACWHSQAPAFCTDGAIRYGTWLRGSTSEDYADAVEKTLGPDPDRFWLVLSHFGKEEPLVLNDLKQTYTILQSEQRTGASIYLFKRR